MLRMEPKTLDRLATANGLAYFGSATDNPELTDTAYTGLLGSQFGAVTPGNAMKWQYTEPARGQFDFGRADQVVDFARAHGQLVRGHTLVWHNQLPGWVTSLPLDQVPAAMENHIATEVAHFAGKVHAWDVVNEPLNEDGTCRDDVFSRAFGGCAAYVAAALETAHAADPDAKLYLNDYNLEYTGAKSDAMYRLASDLLARGVPLDGIGFQGHLEIRSGFPDLRDNLRRFADLGLDVAVTELDVRMALPRDDDRDAVQASYYAQVVDACLAVPRCLGITLWGFTDKYSWVPSAFAGEGAACPWDENLATKPAYDAIVAALGGSTS